MVSRMHSNGVILGFIQAQIIEQNQQKSEISIKTSELFDNEIYLEEIADIIC